MISDKSLALGTTKFSDKIVNNSAILGSITGISNPTSILSNSANKYDEIRGGITENHYLYNRRAMSDDYFPEDFNDRMVEENAAIMDMGDAGMLDNDDDDDFKGNDANNLLFLDNLGNPDVQGYDDQDEPEEEDDDIIKDDEIVMEEDQDDEDCEDESSDNGA
jgi:hypothetical protein